MTGDSTRAQALREGSPERGTLIRSRVWFVHCLYCGHDEQLTPQKGVSAEAEARASGWRKRLGYWACADCAEQPPDQPPGETGAP